MVGSRMNRTTLDDTDVYVTSKGDSNCMVKGLSRSSSSKAYDGYPTQLQQRSSHVKLLKCDRARSSFPYGQLKLTSSNGNSIALQATACDQEAAFDVLFGPLLARSYPRHNDTRF